MRNDYDGLTRMQWRYKQPKWKAYIKHHREYLKRTGYYKARYQRLKTVFKQRGKEWRNKVTAETFAHYGKVCYCCKEQNPLFLTLGHINGDGAAHRRTLKGAGGGTGSGYAFYLWLKRNNYPPLPLQVECYNCNCGKFKNGGICPHQVVDLSNTSVKKT